MVLLLTVDFILVFIDILDIRQTENIPGTVLLFFATQSLFQRRGKYQSSYVFWDLPKMKLEMCKSMTFVVITRQKYPKQVELTLN